jgi:hypothetical protein
MKTNIYSKTDFACIILSDGYTTTIESKDKGFISLNAEILFFNII